MFTVDLKTHKCTSCGFTGFPENAVNTSETAGPKTINLMAAPKMFEETFGIKGSVHDIHDQTERYFQNQVN